MFEVTVNQEKQKYRSKPTMDVDISGSSASIPKPLTYDYMPEGYPSKGIGTVTLMEEQEVAFTEKGSLMGAISPVTLAIKQGDKLTVLWDGVSYDVVVKERVVPGSSNRVEKMFGNLALINRGESKDYPFVYVTIGSMAQWGTTDTATSHTIKVMRQQETITPMSTDFIPKNLNVVFTGIKQIEDQQVPTSCNVTYDELRRFADNDIPIFAIYKYDSYAGVPMCMIINSYDLKSAPLEGNTDMVFYYETNRAFVYNSDGTFSAPSLS